MNRNTQNLATTQRPMSCASGSRRSDLGRLDLASRRAPLRRIERGSRPAGFTLIELLLVLVILSVLAAVVVPKFTSRTKEAKITAAKTDISNLETALDAFEVENGRYPTSEEGLESLLGRSGTGESARSYIGKMPTDPWGNAYIYQSPGSHKTDAYDLYSYGPDGREGGTDDIVNW